MFYLKKETHCYYLIFLGTCPSTLNGVMSNVVNLTVGLLHCGGSDQIMSKKLNFSGISLSNQLLLLLASEIVLAGETAW